MWTRAIDGRCEALGAALRSRREPQRMAITCDFLVIGSGIAGLSFALEAARASDVVLVTKRSRDESNTKYAQGGIAAVLSQKDSFEAHMHDTMVAGAGLTHDRVVELCVKDGPARVQTLKELGARFDLSDGATEN